MVKQTNLNKGYADQRACENAKLFLVTPEKVVAEVISIHTQFSC